MVVMNENEYSILQMIRVFPQQCYIYFRIELTFIGKRDEYNMYARLILPIECDAL